MNAGPIDQPLPNHDSAPFLEAATTQPSRAVATAEAPSERFQSTADFEAWLVSAAIAQYGHLFGQPSYYSPWNWGRPIFFDAVLNLSGMPQAMTTATSDRSFSATNVQIEGVDEADLIETDGEFLYIISDRDLVIVRAGVGDALQIVSRVRLDEKPAGMYLHGDRLALVSSRGSPGWSNGVGAPMFMPMILMAADTEHEHQFEPPTTTVTVLDISDRAAPTLVQKTELDGQLVTSRMVDGQLRLVAGNQFQLPMPIAKQVEPDAGAAPASESVALKPIAVSDNLFAIDVEWPASPSNYVYETQEEYLARVRDELLELASPHFRTLSLEGAVIDESPLVEATDLYRPPSLLDRYMTTIATFDLSSNDAGPAATATVMTGSMAQVYSTADSVYLFASQTSDSQSWDYASPSKSSVWKFAVDNDTHDLHLQAKGQIEGALLNQFAADEHDGYLRVVTTSAGWRSTGQSVQVLEEVGHHLKVVGRIDGIAAGQELYSVRFAGDRAFLVTFRKVDPLFAVDLADPARPRMLGELHIPGYSDYLQPIDENHLVAIGRGADEASGWFQELQVSLFDVTDLTNPQLVHRYSFGGGRSTATPATGDRWNRGDGDHHAVSYFDSEQIFAMPIFSADANTWSWDGTPIPPLFEPGHGGLQVFKIDVHSGFTPIGFIHHDTLVERSLQIGDHLFAISSGTVTVHELTEPTKQLGEISIATESADEPVELTMYQLPTHTPTEPPNVTTSPDTSDSPGDMPATMSNENDGHNPSLGTSGDDGASRPSITTDPPSEEREPVAPTSEGAFVGPLRSSGTDSAIVVPSASAAIPNRLAETSPVTLVDRPREPLIFSQISSADLQLADLRSHTSDALPSALAVSPPATSPAQGNQDRRIRSEFSARPNDVPLGNLESSTERLSVAWEQRVDIFMDRLGRSTDRHSKLRSKLLTSASDWLID